MIACAAIAVAVYYLISQMPPLKAVAGGLPETHVAGAGDDLEPFLGAIAADGRRLYLVAQLVDLLFIGLFGSWLAVGVWRTGARLQVRYRSWLVGLPIAAALVDVVEDLGLLAAATRYPTEALPAEVVSALATLKFLLYGFSIITLVVFGWFAVKSGSCQAGLVGCRKAGTPHD